MPDPSQDDPAQRDPTQPTPPATPGGTPSPHVDAKPDPTGDPTPDQMAYPDGRPRENQPKWRRDFPLQRPEGDYVSRRDFAKFMVLTSGAFVVGHVYIAGKAALDHREGPYPEVAVARLDELPVGTTLPFHYPEHGDTCLLVRMDEETLVAYSQKCTHLACAVQPDFEAGRFNCPCHHAFFDMASGQPLAGPPSRPLPRVLLDVREGTVYAVGMEFRT